MAAGLLVQAANLRGASDVLVASAGFLDGGQPVHEHVQKILGDRGIDMSRKKSQKLRPGLIQRADLVLTMTNDHARGVIGRFPASARRVYTLRHFVANLPARRPGTSVDAWLDQIDADNPRHFGPDEEHYDIEDPIGKPMENFLTLADELISSIDWMLGCAYPGVAID